MARARLNGLDLKKAVGSKPEIQADPFNVAASLAAEHGRVGDVAGFRDLLLNALEHREAFGDAAEVLDGLVREVGLFPYLLNPESLSLKDRFAYEVHKPESFPSDGIVFHAPQARVYWELMQGNSVVLSAPTSFGKSLIIDAIVGSGKFNNILVVVPTIALIDETRRRLASYRLDYKVISHPSQRPAAKNIYVLTQERVLDLQNLGSIDFFVIDEFYKLAPGRDDSSRSSLLNLVFHRLATMGKQFYMLGPDIEGISNEVKERLSLIFVHEPYQTVAAVTHKLTARKGAELDALSILSHRLEGQTLIFCSSPNKAANIAKAITPAATESSDELIDIAVDWISKTYHEDWHFPKALSCKIGIHHGRIPRALAQYVVRLFNAETLKRLICTSTLIEGVNTKARNIVIFDNKINKKPIDFFTFNNICGRSGRMFQHFVGHVYLFHDAPERQLPFVDIPAFSQSADASNELLLQLDSDELTVGSRERLQPFLEQSILSVEVLRKHPDVDPASLISLAKEIEADVARFHPLMRWTYDPAYDELSMVCDLIWRHFNGSRLSCGSAVSASQLATKIMKLKSAPSTREQVEAEISWSGDADEAVQRVLDFNRLWVSFHFPRLLMVCQSVAHEVFSRNGLKLGDFSAFAARTEGFFVSSLVAPLDEYGIPIELTKKLMGYIDQTDLDGALEALSNVNPASVPNLHPFERILLSEAIKGFGLK